jgi:hypothetical protein
LSHHEKFKWENGYYDHGGGGLIQLEGYYSLQILSRFFIHFIAIHLFLNRKDEYPPDFNVLQEILRYHDYHGMIIDLFCLYYTYFTRILS